MNLIPGTELPYEVWDALGNRLALPAVNDIRDHVIITVENGDEHLVPASSQDDDGNYWVGGVAFAAGNTREAKANSLVWYSVESVRPAQGRTPGGDNTPDELGWTVHRGFGGTAMFTRPRQVITQGGNESDQ